MNIHEQYGLTPVINARGTFTPLGVSRSSEGHELQLIVERIAALLPGRG